MQDEKTVRTATQWIAGMLPEGFAPRAAIILGTGLGCTLEAVSVARSIDYTDIPGFPRSTVPGHPGRLLAGTLSGLPVLAWQGRFHLYEGYTPEEVCRGVRISALLGARTLVATNAAGSLNPLHRPGELLAITDHVNLTGRTPLAGPNIDAWGPRFPDMSRAYSRRLVELAEDKAMGLGIRLVRGVYAGVPGPQLETPAETRMLKHLGADAVGMSTVLEVIAARHMGMEVLALSCLVNQNLPDCMAEVTLDQVLAVAGAAGDRLGRLVAGVAEGLADLKQGASSGTD